MRWRALLLGALVVAVVGGVALWWGRGGAQVEVSLGTGITMAPGETMYIGEVPLATGEVTVQSARFRTVEGPSAEGISLDLLAVRQGPRQGGIGAQEDISAYERIDLSSMDLRAPASTLAVPPFDWLVVEVTAHEPGAWRIADLELRYTSGWHRSRTATSVGELCILVTESPEDFAWPVSTDDTTPEGIDPQHYRDYLECTGTGSGF